MKEIKYLKEYKYISICNIDFNVCIYFDYDNEVLLYSLKYIDNDNTSHFLIKYATSFDEEAIDNTIKSFMKDYIANQVDCYIEENNYNEWYIITNTYGFKLINKATQQYAIWNIYDYDEDYEVIQNKIEKFLKLQYNH